MQDTLATAATGNCYSEGLQKVSGHPRLYRRGAVYYHRAVVPADIVETYGKREELISLRTKDRGEALRRVRIKAVEIDNRFAEHRLRMKGRQDLPVLDDLTDEQVRAIRAVYHAHLLEEDAETRLEGFADDEVALPEAPKPTFEEWVLGSQEMSGDAKASLARGRSDAFVNAEAKEVQNWEGVNLKVAPESKGFKKIIRALQEAVVMAMDDVRRRNEGEVVDTPEVKTESLITTPLMSEAVKAWASEKKGEQWTVATEHEHLVWAGHFMALCGDKAIHEYTKEDARHFKEVLLQLPPNWKKKRELRELEIAAAAERASALGLPRMSTTNINKVLRFVGSFWRWAEGQYTFVPKDLFAGLGISNRRKRVRDERHPFTLSDLQKIFSAPIYTGCMSLREWKEPGPEVLRSAGIFWVPIIGLFTGARSNEILQLYVEDVREIHGVNCISINDDGPDKSLKTSNAYREIPIHSKLVQLGFLEFVKQRREEGEKRLFPDMEMGRSGNYSNPFSKHFRRFLKASGVNTPKTSFHSFRHNFEDFCRASRLPMDMVDIFQGHAHEGQRSRYGFGEVLMMALQEGVEQIDFDAVDLSHLEKKH